MVVDGGVHGGHAGKQRRPFLRKILEHRLQLEARVHDDLGAAIDAQVHHHGHGEDVEEGQHPHHAFLAHLQAFEPARALHGVGVEIGVAEHGALGYAGGAAGVLQYGDVAGGIDGGRLEGAVVVEELGEGDVAAVIGHVGDVGALEERKQQAFGKGQHFGHVADDQRLDPGLLQHGLHLGIERFQVEGHHDVGLAVLDLVHKLVFGVERAVVDHRAAGLENAEIANHELRAVGQEEAHLDPLADTQLLEAGGGAAHHVADFAVAVLLAEKVEKGILRKPVDGVVEQGIERLDGNLRLPVDVLRVSLEPDLFGHRPLHELPLKSTPFASIRLH